MYIIVAIIWLQTSTTEIHLRFQGYVSVAVYIIMDECRNM
jgi:hypothetical protein